MNDFKEFGIEIKSKSFVGDKIKITKILDKKVIVHDFKIEESKIQSYRERGAGSCLYLQIELNDEKYIVFTSSCGLIEAIKQIPADKFPFSTTIVKENERFKFT